MTTFWKHWLTGQITWVGGGGGGGRWVGAGGRWCWYTGLYGNWALGGLEWDMNSARVSMGTGNTMVELFSAEMLLRVCKYRSWNEENLVKKEIEIILACRAAGLSMMTSAACLRALLALCSPSAAITLARASRAASASAAMALINCSGTLTSFTSTLSTFTPQGSVPSSRTDCEVKNIFRMMNWTDRAHSPPSFP